MTRRGSAREVADHLKAADRVLVTTHVGPDGDAVGSALALAALLRRMGCAGVRVVMEDPVPQIYGWLSGAEEVTAPGVETMAPSLVVMVDANRLSRIGKVAEVLPPGIPLVTIDHHAEDHPDGSVVFLDPGYASAGEMVAEVFDAAGIGLDRETAEALYTAIATDTGNFRYANTTPLSHRWAARCIEAGIDIAAIGSQVFDGMRAGRFNLMRHILGDMRFAHGGRVAYAEVTPQTLEETGAKPEDLNNLINLGRDIEGVEVAVLFRAMEDGSTKASLRARPGFDAAAVTKDFGGGGHKGAAGCTIKSPLTEAREAVLARIGKSMEAAQA